MSDRRVNETRFNPMLPNRPVPPNNPWQRALYLPLTILAWLAIGIIVFWLLGHISHALEVFALAVIVTVALAPLVGLLRRWLIRPLAIFGAYFVGAAIVVGLGTLLVISAAGQVVNLVNNLPSYTSQIKNLGPQLLRILGPFGVTNADLQTLNQQIFSSLQQAGTSLAASSLSLISRVATILLDAILVLMLSIYFTIDGIRVITWLREQPPPTFRRYAGYFIDISNQVVGGYVRGTISMALLIGMLVGLGLAVLGVPYALLLGILAFFMEFVPVIGVLISGAVSILVALPSGLTLTLIVLVYFIVVHIIEGDVVGPRVMGQAVGIHPATGILALLVGTELFGVWGALFGAPLAGLLQATIVGIWQVRQSGQEAIDEIPIPVPEEQEQPPAKKS